MRITHAIAAILAAATPTAWLRPLDFNPGLGFCIPNPRNDHAAAAKRAARRRRNKAKRG
ncbi:hypothetical protein [Aeromonas salmonicida]|uniref:hypothetical protein n=1 Tax=Aeromonas salmonicida TaxID=645 RepID=UPI00259F317F|nr:hypothetical protein [Aeromonas salmonicida]MDM5100343.1 hypothetical protein [Aeromonas salmonicida]